MPSLVIKWLNWSKTAKCFQGGSGVRILGGQTERIITKDQTYLIEFAAAVRERLARQRSGKTELVVA